jgi:hypothetical protein
MNTRFLIAGIVGFVISMLGGMLFHGFLLSAEYSELVKIGVMRDPASAQSFLPFMLVAHLIKGFAFAWVYTKGLTPGAPAIGQGLKFGVATCFLVAIPLYLVYYAVEPMPGLLVVKQIIFDSLTMILMGVVVSMIVRPAEAK